MANKYIVITQRAWMNENGYGIHYESDLEEFDSRIDVINHGIDITGSDDFNIGVIDSGRLVSLDWMHKSVDGHNLNEIETEIGLR